MGRFDWLNEGSLDDIVRQRLNGKTGPERLEHEAWEHVLEFWARESAESRKRLSEAVAKILAEDSAAESGGFYTAMFNMASRLCLKEAYNAVKEWFERNYYALRDRKEVGADALYALASTQAYECPRFWEGIFMASPEEWTHASFTGLVSCCPREAVKNLRYLHIGIRKELYCNLVRRLYNTTRHSRSRASLLETLFLKAKVREGVENGEGWAVEAWHEFTAETYLNHAAG